MLIGFHLYHTEPVDWIDKETFESLLEDYITRRKTPKAILSFTMAIQMIKILSIRPRQCSIGTASFRHWVRKRFVIQEGHLCPKTVQVDQVHIGKPVCLAEEMLSILIQAHMRGTVHQSFTATYRKAQTMRSWIPREICYQFVQHCTQCHSDYDQLLSLYTSK